MDVKGLDSGSHAIARETLEILGRGASPRDVERRIYAGADDRGHLPRRLEDFFSEVVELGEVGPPGDWTSGELGDRYSLPFAEPDWLPDILAGHDLTGARTT